MSDIQETIIRYADTVGPFVRSEAAQSLFSELEALYAREWRDAETPEKREAAWAKTKALANLKTAMQAVADAGTMEKHKLERSRRMKPAAAL